jgi:hypothetical protein
MELEELEELEELDELETLEELELTELEELELLTGGGTAELIFPAPAPAITWARAVAALV